MTGVDATMLAAFVAALTGLALVVLHFVDRDLFHWQLHDTVRYTLGVGIILIGFWFWAVPTGNSTSAIVLTAIVVVGGTLIIFLHSGKAVKALWKKIADLFAENEALRKQNEDLQASLRNKGVGNE
ncbi:MAG: hypothetical protein FJZ89_13510 [Chloroflexi bacterium]|nr:hypothetical protein [Chloroflexota bacterium]